VESDASRRISYLNNVRLYMEGLKYTRGPARERMKNEIDKEAAKRNCQTPQPPLLCIELTP
jgi:hypothetical protein